MATFKYNKDDANLHLPEGTYAAVVFDAKTGTTKKGDPKIEVVSKAFGSNGVTVLVTDHIVQPYGIARLKKLCLATGVDFDSESVEPSEFIDKNVRVKLKVRVDETGQFPDQNDIVTYLPDESDPGSKTTAPVSGGPDVAATKSSATSISDGGQQTTEHDAYVGFCKTIRASRPDARDDTLKAEFVRITRVIVRNKERAEFTAEDWALVSEKGPDEFIPF